MTGYRFKSPVIPAYSLLIANLIAGLIGGLVAGLARAPRDAIRWVTFGGVYGVVFGMGASLAGAPDHSSVAIFAAETAGGLDAAQTNFVRLLADNERLAALAEIASLFEGLRNEHEGVLEAAISSAFPIDAAQVESIVATLAQRYGRRIKASVSVDPELIGGVSVRIGDEVIDASVRGKLAQMASALTA